MDPGARRFRRAKELFALAVQQPKAERAQWVKEQCDGDEELQGEIESLLSYHESAPNASAAPTGAVERTKQSPIATGRRKKAGPASGYAETELASSTLPGATPGGPRSVKARGRFRQRRESRLIIAAIAAMVLIFVIGRWTFKHVSGALLDLQSQALEELAEARGLALQFWVEDELTRPERLLAIPAVANLVSRALAVPPGPEALPELRKLNAELPGLVDGQLESDGLMVLDRTGRVVLTRHQPTLLGESTDAERMAYALRVFAGETVFMPPMRSRTGERPRVWFMAPVRSKQDRILGALAMGQFADQSLAQILEHLDLEKTSTTYAFDARGRAASALTGVPALKDAGALPEGAGDNGLLMDIRDPGGDVTDGFVAEGLPGSWPLTRLAAVALARAGQPADSSLPTHGVLRDGYRDYRGVPVLGAWRWLDKYSLGIAVEADEARVLAPGLFVRRAFLVLLSLLMMSVIGLTISGLWAMRLRRKADPAESVGPYQLKEKIGEGGMGQVFLAEHALLKRPTAIKLLKSNARDDLTRFEREVRLASQLTHPNTIAIFDFGQSDRGTFFYAMEYLNGVTLEAEVQKNGAMNSARVVHVLRQIAASLNEAHELGLIHRDIKPLNIMLCDRPGETDVVKVLDFGLVKDTQDLMTEATRTEELRGSPRYMAPERLTDAQHVDQRADIYAVGAVAYYLLAGTPAHDGASVVEVLQQVRVSAPAPIATRAAGRVPERLAKIVMSCLRKDPNARPRTAASLLDALKDL